MYVEVHCRTNLDDYQRFNWPTKMYNPRKGDRVRTICNSKELVIVQITHTEIPAGNPCLLIELHKSY